MNYTPRPLREYNPQPLDRSSESQTALDRLRADYVRRNFTPINHRRATPMSHRIAYFIGCALILAAITFF